MSFQQHLRKRVPTIIKGVSMTKPSFGNEVDINQIVDRALKNGTLPSRIQENPVYGEFTRSVEFADAFNLVQKAKEQFSGLDARTRAKFNNDPAQFLAYAENPNNLEGMIELGLAKRKEVEPKAPAAAAPDVPDARTKKKPAEPVSED